jgi:lysophospholipid acyltransferase (LPLAT)-like uncharacterized protein
VKARVLALVYSLLLRLQLLLWRKEVRGLERLDELITARRPVLAVFWHGKYTPLFALLRGRRAVIFTSRSFRGDVIAGICRHFGYTPVQLEDHGRERSLELMRSSLAGVLETFPVCGIAVDGPLGPYHAVKRGPILLASELGYKILPVTFAARRSRIDEQRWDRFEVPSPFSRVVFLLGRAMEVPPGLRDTPEEVERWIARVRDALEALDREAESRL